MTRKQLPRAIRKTSHELRAIVGGPTHDEEAPAPQSALPHDAVKAGSAAAASAPPPAKSLLPAAPDRGRTMGGEAAVGSTKNR